MKSSPVISRTAFEPSPQPDADAADIGWLLSPDLVEASDEIIWSENNNALICSVLNAPSL